MSKFTCGLCKKEFKRGSRFSIDIAKWELGNTTDSVSGIYEACKKCTTDIIKKIDSMKK